MKLVFIENNRPVTDSLTIADVFGKSHDNVMRDIRQQIEKLNEAGEAQWGVLNFEETQYQHQQNKQWYSKFNLTEDAFAIVAMSYVTPEAMKMKVRFLDQFRQMREQLAKPQPALPQTYKEALVALLEKVEENENLQHKIEADRPKVLFADSVEVSKDSILVSDMAKILRQNGIMIGGIRFFQWLRKNGYLIKSGSDYNMPTQRSMELQLFEIKTGTRNGSDGTVRITRTPKVTGKGQIYFLNKFKSKGVTA